MLNVALLIWYWLQYLHLLSFISLWVDFPGGSMVKNPPAKAGDMETESIPGSRRSSGVGNGNPLQYSWLENLMDRGAWWATVHGIAMSRTWLSNWTHTQTYPFRYKLVAYLVKSMPAIVRDAKDVGSVHGLGRCLGEGNGNLLQYSCLENSVAKGAWKDTVHGVTKSQTWLSMHTHTHTLTHTHTHTHTHTQNTHSFWSSIFPA